MQQFTEQQSELLRSVLLNKPLKVNIQGDLCQSVSFKHSVPLKVIEACNNKIGFIKSINTPSSSYLKFGITVQLYFDISREICDCDINSWWWPLEDLKFINKEQNESTIL
jgi:hypothetical protein